ncbi:MULTISPECIES: hypothetical protein [Actinomycetes]|uniref:hypothetical protein n=1 Tax=Actinomycetes TaxID=1760 RepID=UPI0012DE6586|nr:MULTISPECIES: hypothetical protein [Actinomycetes]
MSITSNTHEILEQARQAIRDAVAAANGSDRQRSAAHHAESLAIPSSWTRPPPPPSKSGPGTTSKKPSASKTSPGHSTVARRHHLPAHPAHEAKTTATKPKGPNMNVYNTIDNITCGPLTITVLA